jgi:spore coat polysaccharide biosynthesis protein SpsF (cytidylyltransferase family)
MRLASANGIDVVLGDRDIEITLGRLNGNDNGNKAVVATADADNSSIINEVSARTCYSCAATTIVQVVSSIVVTMLAVVVLGHSPLLPKTLLLQCLTEYVLYSSGNRYCICTRGTCCRCRAKAHAH